MRLMKDIILRLFSHDEKQNLVIKSSVVSNGISLWPKGSKTTTSNVAFPEEHAGLDEGIIEPGSELMLKWNWVILTACFLALFVDPLFFYLPSVRDAGNGTSWIGLDRSLSILVTVFRTIADFFYMLHIVIKFRTGYFAPSSRVSGREELVMDKKMIARRYLRTDFVVDLAAALPLPQVILWIVIPVIKSSNSDGNTHTLALIVFLQYFPRLYSIFPLSSQIIRTAGVVAKRAWTGAVYNLVLYMLASHVIGASWYLLSVERQITCWKRECSREAIPLNHQPTFLDCKFSKEMDHQILARTTSIFSKCDPRNDTIVFKYGIFRDALTHAAGSTEFTRKYLYCLWWGLRSLRSVADSNAQELSTSTFIWETTFAILIATLGLILFAHLIGNMERYLQSITVRVEEWRLKRRDTEQWMKHRQLPLDLQERIRKYLHYKWLATQGVNEDAILQALPTDLRRDIQHHLFLDLVRRVPFFAQMDDPLLDAICERLVSSLSTEGTYLVREGDPVTEMFFVIRGKLESSTTDGGRSGFFNSITLRPGDLCGEELLAWALLPQSSLPSSTRTVRALVEVEAFALRAEDLKFVANQFRRMHSRKLQHTFRYYSHHWRAWASRFIQAAWHRYQRRKLHQAKTFLSRRDTFSLQPPADHGCNYLQFYSSPSKPKVEVEETQGGNADPSKAVRNIGVTTIFQASKFAANAESGRRVNPVVYSKLRKPDEPDFSADPDGEDQVGN